MNILTNTNLHSGGGISKRANEMIRYFEKKKLPLTVIGVSKENYKIERKGSVKIYHVPINSDKKIEHTIDIYKGLKNIDNLEKRFNPTIETIEKIISDEKIDLVLSEGTFYAPWMIHRATKKLNIPMIVVYAGILTKEESDVPEPLNNLFRQIELDFNRLDNFYIFPSRLTKREVEKIFGRKIEKSIVIPNGISKEFFKESYTSKNKNSIGFVGRNHPIKNLEFLISLAKVLDKKGDKYDISAVSKIKDGKKIKKELEDRNIRIIPTMSTDKLNDFFREMGIIICPSFFETYGNVPAESIATGTPALISENMGVSEIFQEIGLTNLILEDFSSTEKVIDKVKENVGLSIKKSIIEQIRETLTWDSTMGKYVKTCEEALS